MNYRENAKPIVHVEEIKPVSFLKNILTNIYFYLYKLTASEKMKNKWIQATLNNLPIESTYCVDCNKPECECVEFDSQ